MYTYIYWNAHAVSGLVLTFRINSTRFGDYKAEGFSALYTYTYWNAYAVSSKESLSLVSTKPFKVHPWKSNRLTPIESQTAIHRQQATKKMSRFIQDEIE